MKLTIIVRSTLFTAVCLLASNMPSSAQVVNGSFEDPTSPFFQKTNGAPYSDQYPPYNNFPTVVMFNGWESLSHQGGIRYAETSTAGLTGADGSYAIQGLDGAGGLESLNPAATIAANTTYTLTLALDIPAGTSGTSFQLLATSQGADPTTTYTYNPDGNGYVSVMSPNPLITTLGTLADSGALSVNPNKTTDFEDYTISFDTLGTDNSAYIGDNLSILINFGGTASLVDNVRLTEVSVPEPGTWALMVAGIAGLLFIGRRKLNA